MTSTRSVCEATRSKATSSLSSATPLPSVSTSRFSDWKSGMTGRPLRGSTLADTASRLGARDAVPGSDPGLRRGLASLGERRFRRRQRLAAQHLVDLVAQQFLALEQGLPPGGQLAPVLPQQ